MVIARFCFRSLPISLTVITVVCSVVYFRTSPLLELPAQGFLAAGLGETGAGHDEQKRRDRRASPGTRPPCRAAD